MGCNRREKLRHLGFEFTGSMVETYTAEAQSADA